jgi:hypothetical protein
MLDKQQRQTSSPSMASTAQTPATSAIPSTPSHDSTAHQPFVASREQADLFDHYRNNMAPHFPFVQISDDYMASDVVRAKPFLAAAIAVVADYQSLRSQRAKQRQLLQTLTQRMFLHSEKSLDLLQGILVLCSWYHFFMFDTPQLSNLLNLASALCVDMGLNRFQHVKDWSGVVKFARTVVTGSFDPSANAGTRNLDEMRAYLGVYFLQAVWVGLFIYSSYLLTFS